ncbi:hypothetical protein BCR44DRAFT_117719 [Catenaria anguillulae PL171]|uniref:Transmembrane protein n=1 Tax=Catenaria anguillulae PL171 TaxID=765915 RepID=A0A1Y2HAS6_9FUNG|nr:hypothetical protein BCR44DRAFT_117719 [Catenaria anguillulae PL171]
MNRSSIRQRTAGVSTVDESSSSLLAADNRDAAVEPKTLTQQIAARVPSLLWLSAAIAVCIYSELIGTIRDGHINWTAGILCIISFSLSVLTFLYLNIWVPYVERRTVDLKRWEVTAPTAIPFATASGVAGFVCATVALWPAYHILTLPLLFILFMGFVGLVSLV